jgi:hypothetical protein
MKRTSTTRSVSTTVEFISIKSSAAKGEDEPGIRQGTVDVPYQIADAHLPEAVSVFDAATALDTAMHRADPQLTMVELLVRHVLLPRECLPQIEINSGDCSSTSSERYGVIKTAMVVVPSLAVVAI